MGRRRRRGSARGFMRRVAGFPFEFTGTKRPPNRKGQRCRKDGKGGVPGTVYVEFATGGRFLVDERQLARADDE